MGRLLRPLLLGLALAAAALPAAGQVPIPGPPTPTAAQPAVDPLGGYFGHVLDFDVPESPAFAALGVAPGDVLGAAAAKPIMVNLLMQAGRGGTLDGGLALDFSPVMLLAAVRPSALPLGANDRPSPWVSRLSRVSVSLGSVSSELDSADVRAGWGVRVNLADPRDPLQNPVLRRQIVEELQRILVENVQPSGSDTSSTGKLARRTLSGNEMSEVYERARKAARSTPGLALTVGYGGAGVLQSSVLDADSLTSVRHRGWVAFQYSSGSPAWDVQGMLDYAQGPGDDDDGLRAGMALRAHTAVVSLAGELTLEDDGLEPALKAEMRVIPRMSLVASLETERDALTDGTRGEPTLRFKTHVKWNLSETR